MRFRTEIERPQAGFEISHDDKILLLGSCFSDNVGVRLQRDGFDVKFNPMGPLYNPVSLSRLLFRLCDNQAYSESDFTQDESSVFHCLDFASRYQNKDVETLAATLNEELDDLRHFFNEATVIVFTLGSSFVYSLTTRVEDAVGNCHKFPADKFTRFPVDVDKIVGLWRPMLQSLKNLNKKVLLTVSPIRHLADGLHGNQLSKARLLLACEVLSDLADYFPSYEMLLDDLRDYRFYAADMKHPSEQACDYIYEHFSNAYFNDRTLKLVKSFRDKALRDAHRQLL